MMLSIARHQIMIQNGLYLAETRFLDGVEAYNRHVMVLRDGTMRGGGGFYYTVGSYTCSGGKWKGEMTSREHSPISVTYPWAGKVPSIGFTGTYSNDGAEFEATALAGRRSFRFKSVYRFALRRLKKLQPGRIRKAAMGHTRKCWANRRSAAPQQLTCFQCAVTSAARHPQIPISAPQKHRDRPSSIYASR